MSVRNTITTHPAKSLRRERALGRLELQLEKLSELPGVLKKIARITDEIQTLNGRIGRPPRAWAA